MQVDPSFYQKIDYLDIDSIKNSLDTIYIVDRDLRLRAYNNAWIIFARNNEGDDVLSTYRWGDKIDGSFPEDLKNFYISAYQKALATNSVFEHDYECSSPTQFRIFHQTAHPLVGGHGLVVSNHLIKEITHPDQKIVFNEALIDAHGNITQCCHCRKLKDPSVEGRWVWVPSIVKDPVKNTSHTLCPRCLDFYYPDVED